MIFSLLITASPHSQASYSAWRFAQTLLQQGHSLYRVFFYQDGSYHGSQLTVPPQQEWDPIGQWQQLQQQYSLELVVCIAAGLRRGIIDSTEADRYQQQAATLADGMALVGLGELVDASIHCDRLVTFGG